jgi:DNA transposition AAA+ family ATPase
MSNLSEVTAKAGGYTDPEVKQRLDALMRARGWSQRKASEQIGVSQTALCRWWSDKYEAAEAMNTRVAEFLDGRRQAGEGVVPSEGLLVINEICRQAHEERKFGVVQGNPGVGKTKALLLYQIEHDGVVYVRADVTTNVKVMLERICGIHGGGRTAADLMEEAKPLVAGKVIIVDEADLLSVRVLEALRAIYDEGHCGLVLAGTPRLERLLRRGPHATDNLAQLYSRVDFNVTVLPPCTGDMEKFLDTAHIEDKGARKIISQEGSKGSFRAAAKLTNQALRLARVNGVPVSEAVVKAAGRLIMRPLMQA